MITRGDNTTANTPVTGIIERNWLRLMTDVPPVSSACPRAERRPDAQRFARAEDDSGGRGCAREGGYGGAGHGGGL